jgi:isopropylmalate/homocitrate/citramalate synthase
MLSFDDRTNTLSYQGHGYSLREPEKPQLFREQFPFSELPKLSWNHRQTPMRVPTDVWVCDSTFLTGQRRPQPYTSDQIVHLFELLVRLGGTNGVVRQTEMPIATAEERAALTRCLDRDYVYPVITAHVGGADRDFALARTLGLREAGFPVPASDYQIRLRSGRSRRDVVERTTEQVRAALDQGLVPRCHLIDVTRGDVFGFVIPLVKQLLAVAESYRSKVKVRLVDSFGVGVPYNGTSLPRSVPALINAMTHYAGVPTGWLEWAGSNDLFKAVTNAATAWQFGCAGTVGTLLGLGARSGVVPIEALIVEYAQLRGTLNGCEPTVLTELGTYARDQLGLSIPPRTPLLGERYTEVDPFDLGDPALPTEPREAVHAIDTHQLLKRELHRADVPNPVVAKSGANVEEE